jgi:type IV pilus assembly protein PilE
MTKRSLHPSHRRARGWSLTELMVTLAVLAIIMAIAVPAYTNQMQKSRRADARNALLDIAGREERFLSVTNNYSQVTTDVGYGGVWPQQVFNGFYSVTVQSPDPAFLGNGPSFIITATTINAQAGDTSCATFTLNQVGVQVALTSGGVVNTPACWGL